MPARGSRAARQAESDERSRAYEAKERATLASWSDDRFRLLVESVEAGNHTGDEGSERGVMFAEVFELRFIENEARRRGWPAPIIGAPRQRAGRAA